jgi:phage virion morphogenesis protein
MAGTQFLYEDEAVAGALRRAADAGANTADMMDEIAAAMLYGVQRRFETETAPDGSPWAALKPQTIRRRKKGRANRGAAASILRDTNLLYTSITPVADAVEAVVGTNLVYAAIHQNGGVIERLARSTTVRLRRVNKRTRFASKRVKSAKERWVTLPTYGLTIPARPFLGWSDTDRAAALAIAHDHFAAAFAAAGGKAATRTSGRPA